MQPKNKWSETTWSLLMPNVPNLTQIKIYLKHKKLVYIWTPKSNPTWNPWKLLLYPTIYTWPNIDPNSNKIQPNPPVYQLYTWLHIKGLTKALKAGRCAAISYMQHPGSDIRQYLNTSQFENIKREFSNIIKYNNYKSYQETRCQI